MERKWKQHIGIVIRGIEEEHGTTLEVLCPELSPNIVGSPSAEPEERDFAMGEYSGSVKVSDTVLVDWLDPSKTNRSCPDIVPGEQVWVYQYANMDEYFWLEMGKDVELRSREHIKVFIMNEPKIASEEEPITPTNENTYYVEMDSRTGSKKIEISTGCSDGEAFAYTVTILPEEKTVTVTDQAYTDREINADILPNIMVLSSPTGKFSVTNKNECNATMEEDNIDITAIATITCKSTNTIINTTEDTTVNARDCVVNAERKCDVTAPDTNVTGNVTLKSGVCTAVGAPGPADSSGAFGGILVCPFAGLSHTTSIINVS